AVRRDRPRHAVLLRAFLCAAGTRRRPARRGGRPDHLGRARRAVRRRRRAGGAGRDAVPPGEIGRRGRRAAGQLAGDALVTGLTLLPAVDVTDGRAVQLVQGVAGSGGQYGDPKQAALAWQRAGASWIHLVDLDAAFGRGSNADLLADVVRTVDVQVEMSGGIRDDASLERALRTGCARVNIGTAALENPDWVRSVIARHGERVAVGLDVRGTRLAARGWTAEGGELHATLDRLNAEGCARYVVTDVVKGVNFRELRDAGDPVELAAFYDAEGADELTFLDITASSGGRDTMYDVVRRTAEQVFIPLTVGGGVRGCADVDRLLRAGADKVSLNTAAVARPDLLAETAGRFGSQCMVLSVDARRADGPASGFEVTTHGGRTGTGIDAVDWARRATELGAGEILLNSMDADGTTIGFDLELIRAVRAVVTVPVIASGGAGTLAHV